MTTSGYAEHAEALSRILCLQYPPIAISFSGAAPSGMPRYAGDVPAPSADGRTGKVPAGCVFWIKAEQGSFTTIAEDHASCNVGSLTHGFKTLAEAATGGDVAALVEAGWVTPEVFPQIPVVQERPGYISYGPLAEVNFAPDVVFLRINAKQAMALSDALPGLRFEGKPQCHIIPMAKEQNEVAVSVGCMLSRVRTGMANTEMSCAIPAARLAEVIGNLEHAAQADKVVAAYAAEDARRFGSYQR